MNSIHVSTPRFASRLVAIITIACCVLGARVASADCSEKARALGKCPQTHAVPKAKSNVHLAGASPVATAPKTATKHHGVPGVGPSPIEHSDKNALNPQPIPPGRPVHPLPPPGTNEPGGH